ncbi:MAG: AMP-binding protein [Desulfomonile sp.]|jgi:long-chain acyl-CoA synthetase|nr:AMP-binding protein [Deltaproteobacteria bacterium]
MAKATERVIDGFYSACEKFPDRTALIYLGEEFSYRALKELIERFATALHDLGVRRDDKVMLYIPNTPQFLIAYLGAQVIGGIPVPVSPIYTPTEIRYLINDCRAKTVICLNTNFRYVKEVFFETGLERIIVTTYVEMLPLYKRVFGFLFDKVPSGAIETGTNIYWFGKLLSQYPAAPPKVDIDPGRQLCYILYTGGTTGFPKGCIATHSGMVSFINEIKEFGEGHVREGEDTLIMVNPLFHQLAQGMILGMILYNGNTAVLMPIPEVDSILDAIQRYRVTLFLGAPTLYRMMLENDRLDLFDLNSLRFCWSGGDVLPVEIFNRWKNMFKQPIYQVYGSTEVGFTAMSPLDREPSPTRVGRTLPSRKTMVVDPETLAPMPQGEPGELLVTSDFISKQYWNKPEETARAYVEINGEVWYRMNDFVRLEENGEISYVDRRADVIKHKGYRVSCSEIEAVLQDHPAVIGSCVVGVPDPKFGERIKAIVVLNEDARGVSGPELVRWCRERLAAYKVPQYIEFRDMLPKSKVGKLLRREIRDEERRKLGPKKL